VTVTSTPTRGARFSDVVRSEWTKIRTVPSTLWALVAATVLAVGIGALVTAVASHHYVKESAHDRALWDPTGISTSGLALAQLAIVVLAVLMITSEYSSGAIRTTLAAVPNRARLLVSKVVVVATIAFVAGEVLAFAAFFIGQALISGNAPSATLGQSSVLRALIGCGLDGAVIAVLGVALGALLRSAAAAISAFVAMVFILPGIAAALPSSIEQPLEKFWPTQAGQQVTNVVRASHTLPPWAGFGVFCLFTAVVLAAALTRLDRTDA
jgi:ABC-2 type transport system permease protein